LFQLNTTAGFESVAVPHKGRTDAVKALIVGEVDFIITPAFLPRNLLLKSK
jgi:tripartite-type tricarboxylate transporter receptor subunit TctC